MNDAKMLKLYMMNLRLFLFRCDLSSEAYFTLFSIHISVSLNVNVVTLACCRWWGGGVIGGWLVSREMGGDVM